MVLSTLLGEGRDEIVECIKQADRCGFFFVYVSSMVCLCRLRKAKFEMVSD